MCDIRAKDIIQWQNEQSSYRDEKGKPYALTYLKTLQSELSALFNHAVLRIKEQARCQSRIAWERESGGNAFLDERGISEIH